MRLEALESGMYLLGCTYNLCFAHHELCKAKHQGHALALSMEAGVTNHFWTVEEVLVHKVAPAPWCSNIFLHQNPSKQDKNIDILEVLLDKRCICELSFDLSEVRNNRFSTDSLLLTADVVGVEVDTSKEQKEFKTL